MKGWIRTDFDFGTPWAQLLLLMHSPIAQELMREINAMPDTGDPLAVENVLLQFVEQHRPDLRGCSVVFFEIRFHMLRIGVIHGSLPRVSVGDTGETRFELCAKCGGVMKHDTTL